MPRDDTRSRRPIQENVFWQARARRLALEGAWADAKLVAFDHSSGGDSCHDPESEGGGGTGHRIWFKIDGASSRCVRHAWRRVGGVRTSKAASWTLLWGKPLKYADHKKLTPFQRVCHFPGTWYGLTCDL